ncbi:MAG: transglutaminase-like domain-containing protein [Bacillota bacterium]|nr:transglutaminase-like domain-containing protein [Bacillota bacterium]
MKKKTRLQFVSFLLTAALIFTLAGCGAVPAEEAPAEDADTAGETVVSEDGDTASDFEDFVAEAYLEEEDAALISISEEEMVPLTESGAAVSADLMPVASGTVVYTGGGATIDASNTAEGYIMVKYGGTSTARLKVMVTGPSGTNYTYNLNTQGNYETFPLSDGNGTYKLGVYQNVSGNRYSVLLSKSVSVSLENEFAPFLRPNQYVNYATAGNTVAKAAELCQGKTTELEKVEAVYHFVVKNFTYDKEKAASVQSGYLPDVDAVLAARKGICFDYAAVMAAMLRSQGVPTKLVVGYTGSVYHAWINCYSADSGWIDGVIFFDGSTWKLMDPTFASSANSSAKIMEYIGTGSNYTAKYLY